MNRFFQKLFSALNRILFRASGGRLGSTFRGAPIALVTTVGAKSGKHRTVPLMYLDDGGRFVLVASNGGAASHPSWYINLRKNPRVSVETREGRRNMLAETASPQEAEALWPKVDALYSGYAGYREKTERTIPIVVLTGAAAGKEEKTP